MAESAGGYMGDGENRRAEIVESPFFCVFRLLLDPPAFVFFSSS